MADADKFIAENSVGIVLLDFGLIDAFGLRRSQATSAARPTSIVLLADVEDEAQAMITKKEGVQDYRLRRPSS